MTDFSKPDPNQPPNQPYPTQPPPAPYSNQPYPNQPPPGYGQPGGYPAAPPAPAGYPPAGMLMLPPGVELASKGRRIGAFFLMIPLYVVTLGLGYIIWGLVLWGKGTSPAFRILGMKVWKVDQQRPADFGTMALRDIVGAIVEGILSIITLLISFFMFLSGEQRQTLRDKIATTTVVYDPHKVLG